MNLSEFLSKHSLPSHVRFAGTPHECIAILACPAANPEARREAFRLSDYFVRGSMSGGFLEMLPATHPPLFKRHA
jgi:hypothetical protein